MTLSGESRPDLRTAALAAEVYLRIDAARAYGFIDGGPTVNVERCEEVVEEARAAGVTYTEVEILEATRNLLAWHNAEPAERAAVLGEDKP